jgi:hypothetical protein
MLDYRARARPVLQHPPDVHVAARRRRNAARGAAVNSQTAELIDVRAPRAAEAGAHPGGPARLAFLVRLINSNPPAQETLDR